ncbi:MAG: LysR family transcriptional regulator [Proteobacteria bacterium]|nr:LysR family transcriptional regulator [Pseudomonadota bacterium]
MHLSRIDLNLLVVFDTVFTAGSITAASRKLNLSQPAVSHALARLRDVFGEPLFERQGRGIVPTPLARSIAGPVREALGVMERTFGQAAGFEPTTAERHFRIGLREALEPGVLPALSRVVCAAGPRLGVSSARHDRPRLETDLAAGEFDVALDVLLPAADRVPHERVLTDRLVVIARKDHPRLRRMRRSGWNLDAYLALDHVQVSSRRRGASLEDVALQSLGQARRIRLRCQSHAAACGVAASTDLVATLPETYARHVLERDMYQVVELPLAGIRLETYMYWPANAERDAANRWLRDQVRTALRSRR